VKVDLDSIQRVLEREYAKRPRFTAKSFEDEEVSAVVRKLTPGKGLLESIKQ
jgi:hypothetical protein